MTDTFTPEERSKIMSRIRSRDNVATELRFMEIMRDHRITGWRRNVNLPGHPDFVFKRERVIVFVDGDFWHGNPKGFRLPKSNLKYWQQKILSNRKRDRRISRLLRSRGWTVLRFWQSSLKHGDRVARRVQRYLRDDSHRPRPRTKHAHASWR